MKYKYEPYRAKGRYYNYYALDTNLTHHKSITRQYEPGI